MAMEKTKVEAERIIKNWFSGGIDEISREDVPASVSDSTFYNYMALLKEFELAEAIKDDPADKRKTTKVRLTEAGKQLVSNKAAGKQVEASVPTEAVTLETVTKLTDEFSRQNPSWEWKLMRKEVAEHQ